MFCDFILNHECVHVDKCEWCAYTSQKRALGVPELGQQVTLWSDNGAEDQIPVHSKFRCSENCQTYFLLCLLRHGFSL